MSIYFGFSDESGCYQQAKEPKFLRSHPFYIRSTLLIKADEWKQLNEEFQNLKIHYDFPLDKEIKWSYLWNIRIHQKKKEEIPDDRSYKFLETYDYKDLISFVEACLALLNNLSYKKIIISHTKNATCGSINEKSMLKMHLQEHMQRVEMQIQTRSEENLAILFFDPISKRTDKLLRDIYFDLFKSGDFISEYKHIKDSLNIENSHQSVGIQLADYIAGAFSSMLKGISSSNYERGKELYLEYVHPNLRKYNGTIWGIGIREVPSMMSYRKYLSNEFNKIAIAYFEKKVS